MANFLVDNKAMSTNESFIPKEIGVLPRVLLLDFDEADAAYLRDLGYEIIEGQSGFSNKRLKIPRHESEIEIIFWNTANIRNDNQVTVFDSGSGYDLNTSLGRQTAKSFAEVIKKYFERIAEKNGFVGIFLDDTISIPVKEVGSLLNSNFSFKRRNTTTLYLNQHKENDVWFDFYKRFVKKENVNFAIDWNDNLVGFTRYFEDEDENIHAVTYRHFAIIPKIEDKQSALTYLLQDVLPHHCDGENIFPDKYYYRWANNTQYLPPEVKRLQEEIELIISEANIAVEDRKAEIQNEINNNEYLTSILIADDSDLFPEDKKLSTSLHKVLEDDLGFQVTNVDEMRLQIGESLKEDKWIEDGDFFALVEIKGTERGAKANWVRQDLSAHIREFEVVKGVTGINSVLIFNHERREAPEERKKPFAGDTDLITFAQKSNICLLPTYELFKLVRAVKNSNLTKEDARERIKSCKGMFCFQI